MNALILNTFVRIAPDCPVQVGTIPPERAAGPTIAALQYALLAVHPYQRTLEELMFAVYLRREGLTDAEAVARAEELRAKLFGKPYPCMRASPLPKRFGWGVHHDGTGRLALYGAETAEYARFAAAADGVQVVVAMRTSRSG